MNTKNKNQTMGALAPTKNKIFSINAVEKSVRVRYVNSAPQQEQEIRRIRAD